VSRSYITDDVKGREKKQGFCRGKSCLKSQLKGFEGISESVDVDDLVDVVYLAFLKAFGKGCLMKGPYRN